LPSIINRPKSTYTIDRRPTLRGAFLFVSPLRLSRPRSLPLFSMVPRTLFFYAFSRAGGWRSFHGFLGFIEMFLISLLPLLECTRTPVLPACSGFPAVHTQRPMQVLPPSEWRVPPLPANQYACGVSSLREYLDPPVPQHFGVCQPPPPIPPPPPPPRPPPWCVWVFFFFFFCWREQLGQFPLCSMGPEFPFPWPPLSRRPSDAFSVPHALVVLPPALTLPPNLRRSVRFLCVTQVPSREWQP